MIKLNFLKTFLIILFILIYHQASAQFTVNGKLINQQEQSIEHIEVNLTNVSDMTNIKTALTDETGKFSLSVARGNYTLSANYLKQELIKKNLFVTSNINLGIFKVSVVNQIKVLLN